METTNNNRNNQGRFVKGHSGAKPKGAVSKKNRKYFERIERVVNLLETNIDENIKNMSNKVYKLLGDECYSSEKLQSIGFSPKKSLKDMNETSY